MIEGRWAPTATTLPQGMALVAGGWDGLQTVQSAELYYEPTNSFLETGPLAVGRNFATATLLDNGKVLVAGGFHGVYGSLNEAELYDPLSGTFRPTLGLMNARRELFTATKLPNGKVLLVGGLNANTNVTEPSAELYDPATETFKPTGSLSVSRFGHDAVYLPTVNKVLVVGGKQHSSASAGWFAQNTAELYDVATGKFTRTKAMASQRDRPTVCWVPALKKALVIGGKSEANGVSADVLPTEWFDPATGAFTKGPSLAQGRMAHTLTALPDGSFLAAGGWNVSLNRTLATAERFVPSISSTTGGSFVAAGTMSHSRHDGGAALLPDGKVLVAGGKEVNQNPGAPPADYLSHGDLYSP
jgi:hypothetical protein